MLSEEFKSQDLEDIDVVREEAEYLSKYQPRHTIQLRRNGTLEHSLCSIKIIDGVPYAKTKASTKIAAGWHPMINKLECEKRGLDPFAVMAARSPVECLLKLGANSNGLEIEVMKKESAPENLAEIAKNIESEFGATVADCWRRYKSSDAADEVEDVFAAAILRQAGY